MLKKRLPWREELAIIDRAIVQLGLDSYLGPWLASVRDEVERDIRSDFSPMSDLPDAAYRKGERIRVRAVKSAELIVATAVATADERAKKIRTTAEAQCAAMRAQVRYELDKLAKVAESM